MKTVLVVGYALSGKSAALLLNKNGYHVTVTDKGVITDKEYLESLGIQVYDQGHPDFLVETKWDFVVKNPGIKPNVDFIVNLVSRGNRIVSEIEVALMFADKYKYAIVTGTNGKTTTTTLLYEMLNHNQKALVGGNIGIPVSQLVLDNDNIEINAALELSSFQLDITPSIKPTVSVIMNLTPDHLDYYNSLTDYYLSKLRVFVNQTEDQYFLLNLDDEVLLEMIKDVQIIAKTITFSTSKPADLFIQDNKVFYKDIMLFNVSDLKIVGEHNVVNAMVASCMAYLMDVDVKTIQQVLKSFVGVKHRLQFVTKKNDILFYNDSKATNVESMVVGLKAFSKPVIVLAGGYDKKVGFDLLKDALYNVKYMIAFGQTKEMFKNIYPDTIVVENMDEAFNKAIMLAQKDDIVLLSPGCASFDQFKNFEQRGDYFIELVEKY